MKKNIKKVPEVVRGTLIEITERKCSAKMQQHVKVGNIEKFNFESPAIVKGINMIKNRLLTIHFNVVDDSI